MFSLKCSRANSIVVVGFLLFLALFGITLLHRFVSVFAFLLSLSFNLVLLGAFCQR